MKPTKEVIRTFIAVDGESGCWIWQGRRDRQGYGHTKTPGDKKWLAHRLTYTVWVGPIPDGLEIDHLCRVTSCVNPEHLEPVTRAENARRRAAAITHCAQGHEFTAENTYVWINKRGRSRACRTCNRECQARRARRAREAAA